MSAKEYFEHLQDYLNLNFYRVFEQPDKIILKEKVQIGDNLRTKRITLNYSGKLFAIKLDKQNTRGNHNPLFHFLDNNGRPWSKRCDFILFNYRKRQIRVFLFEFKSRHIRSRDISKQLESSKNWCKSLAQTIKAYTSHSATMHVTKYLLTINENPVAYLDESEKYLSGHDTIRHYWYNDIDDMHLDDLDNNKIEKIK